MNNLNFQQLGGFPLETNTLTEVQKAYSIFNAYGSLAGNKTIITGCDEIGDTVTNGFIYLDDELLEFRGGTKQSKIIIKQEIQEVEFEDKTIKPVYYTRYATFGTGVNAINWSDFKKIDPLTSLMNKIDVLEKKSAVFTQGGGMVLWNKPANQIPEGWKEVINWRGRMPVGYDPTQSEFNQIGKPGGAKTKTLSINEIPPHDHGVKAYAGTKGTIVNAHISSPVNGGSGDKTEKTGGGQPFSLLNPYRTVMFIEYIG